MKMKRGVVVAAVMGAMALAAGAQTSATVKDDLFAGTEIFAKNATDINEITMDPGTLGMVDGKDSRRAHNMVLSVVRTYSYDKPGMYRIEDVDAFRNKLNTGEWHCSVHTRSMKTGESTDVCNKQRTDDMKETAIITVEPKQLTFIHTIGKTSSSSWSGGPGMAWQMNSGIPSVDRLMAPAMRAEMAVDMAQMQAQMHVQLAEMRAMNPQINSAIARAQSTEWPRVQVQIDQAMRMVPKIDSADLQRKVDDAMRKSADALKKSQSEPKQPE